mgnify:FL=1
MLDKIFFVIESSAMSENFKRTITNNVPIIENYTGTFQFHFVEFPYDLNPEGLQRL